MENNFGKKRLTPDFWVPQTLVYYPFSFIRTQATAKIADTKISDLIRNKIDLSSRQNGCELKMAENDFSLNLHENHFVWGFVNQ